MTTISKPDTSIIEQVVINGDLAALTPEQRLSYYNSVCESLGLNPLTKPFEYLKLNNRLVLYARRDATDQLRTINQISVSITAREMVGDIYVVTARATKGGRSDESIGAVPVGGLKGEALANAMMKSETKAKRRVTLSINGLGFLDETEVESIPDARIARVDQATGEIQNAPERTVAAIQPPAPVKAANKPSPKSTEAKLKQLNQARYDSDGNEVISVEMMNSLVYDAYEDHGPRDLTADQLDTVITQLLALQPKWVEFEDARIDGNRELYTWPEIREWTREQFGECLLNLDEIQIDEMIEAMIAGQVPAGAAAE